MSEIVAKGFPLIVYSCLGADSVLLAPFSAGQSAGIAFLDNPQPVLIAYLLCDLVQKFVPPPTIGFVDGTDHLAASQESVPLIV